MQDFPPANTPYAAGVYMRRLGIVLTQIARLDTEEERAVQAVRDRFAKKRKPALDKAIALAKPLRAYAEDNRHGSALSIAHAGKFDWISRPFVIVHNAARAIAAIKRRGKAVAKRHLRIKVEISKHAIHADPALVAGIRSISIEHSDTLKIKPDEAAYAVEYDRKNGAYSISKPRKAEALEEDA